jgi:hypothetical protein
MIRNHVSMRLTGSLCYFVNVLDLLWIWVFPSSTSFFICSYLLTMGTPSRPRFLTSTDEQGLWLAPSLLGVTRWCFTRSTRSQACSSTCELEWQAFNDQRRS